MIEGLVFLSTDETATAVHRAVAGGRAKKIGPRLYTTEVDSDEEDVVRRHLWTIAGLYTPGALVADRTAFEYRPAPDGSIFLVADRTTDVDLPGAVLRYRRGVGPIDGDTPYIGGLFVPSTARAFLDNLVRTRSRKTVARTLGRDGVETRLDALARRGGEAALNKIRDEARRIAPLIGRETEFEQLDEIIGGMLGTRQVPLATPGAIARASGKPFDSRRVELMAALAVELRDTAPVTRTSRLADTPARVRAFFEAYFSNFIEGTEFTVDEAIDIVFQNRVPTARPKDAHDILGTFQLVAAADEMRRVPRSASELVDILRARHATLMAARPEVRPGLFKERPNQAGSTRFVEPADVMGTLEAGYNLYRSLNTPFARAVFMMFLVSEVHPFDDGNGRVARIMMNAELETAGEARIIVPTVYRLNYLSALKALSQSSTPQPLVRALDFAQRWTATVDWTNVGTATRDLRSSNALMDATEAEDAGLRLRIPR